MPYFEPGSCPSCGDGRFPETKKSPQNLFSSFRIGSSALVSGFSVPSSRQVNPLSDRIHSVARALTSWHFVNQTLGQLVNRRVAVWRYRPSVNLVPDGGCPLAGLRESVTVRRSSSLTTDQLAYMAINISCSSMTMTSRSTSACALIGPCSEARYQKRPTHEPRLLIARCPIVGALHCGGGSVTLAPRWGRHLSHPSRPLSSLRLAAHHTAPHPHPRPRRLGAEPPRTADEVTSLNASPEMLAGALRAGV